MVKAEAQKWQFKARFRRHAFGWQSQPAITRIKQAVSEIEKVAKRDPRAAAEGAVLLLERLSPALEHVDSSSGSMGTAVNSAIASLVPVIAGATVDETTRAGWLERLFEAHQADGIPYIERLTDYWAELCVDKHVASAWADRLLDVTRKALSPNKNERGHFHGTSACLSALYGAERFDELIELLRGDTIWPYKQWAVRALAGSGRKAEALRYAEACRSPWANDAEIDALCEELLLSSGLIDEAYGRYGLIANRRGTYLATFRAIAKKYPQKAPAEILGDLVKSTPGDEGKWFAAAKDAGLFDDALALASRTPCDTKTLARAARDYGDEQPAFAVGAGLLALHWLGQGYGYEITGADVLQAYLATLVAADRLGQGGEVKVRIRAMLGEQGAGAPFVRKVLGRELGL